MPELPEVETMRRGVLGVVGARIEDAVRPPSPYRAIAFRPRFSTLRRRLVGRRITAVDRAGKRVVLVCDNQLRLVIEPRMTGLVLVAEPPDVEHLRLRLELQDAECEQLLFWDRRGLGTVSLFDPTEFDRRLGPEKLGPDALTVSADELRNRFRTSRRAIKVGLLDQAALAGIGNLYASEILHVAAIDPRRRANTLRIYEWQRLAEAIDHVLEEAIRYEGSTLGDGTYRNALNQAGSYQNHHRVYDRAGEPCWTCRQANVRRIVQAQRSTFLCPTCQPRRPVRVVPK